MGTTTVLVTGATGFVGSHTLEALRRQEGVRPIAACRDRSRLRIPFEGEVREGDLRDSGYVESVLRDIDVVCHPASWVSAWDHRRESRRLFLEPTLRFIDAARAAGVRRFVFPSTTSVQAPTRAADPMARGIARGLWPHMANVVAIEDRLRELAAPEFQVVNLRLGIFVGRRYGIGVLPLLLPRLKTHLVPWVNGGRTTLPLVVGEDIGQAFARAATAEGLEPYEGFTIVGPEVPTVREVIDHLHDEYGYPRPHFSVPFSIAYVFARTMELLDPVVPWEPLVTRSIVHLLEETGTSNDRAWARLGYVPRRHWTEGVREQIEEMRERQPRAMKMAHPV